MWLLIYRAVVSGFYTLYIVLLVAFWRKFGGKSGVQKSRAVRKKWAKNLFPMLGIQVKRYGNIPHGQCIFVANHRSYLDPLLMLRDVDALPVSKSELGDWWVIGWGAKMSGVILLDRQNKVGGVATLRAMSAALKHGESIIIFPEGTTNDQTTTLSFLKGAFQLAARYKVSIAPVALIFENPEDFWIGDETFGSHASRRFREKSANIQVHYGKVLQSSDADFLLQSSKKWIDERLLLWQRKGETAYIAAT